MMLERFLCIVHVVKLQIVMPDERSRGGIVNVFIQDYSHVSSLRLSPDVPVSHCIVMLTEKHNVCPRPSNISISVSLCFKVKQLNGDPKMHRHECIEIVFLCFFFFYIKCSREI